jgi:hypothetical protein
MSLVDKHQTVDSDASANRRLENFIKKVTRKRASPLIHEPPKPLPAKALLPLRGEILIMQRLGLVTGLSTPSASVKRAYEALYTTENRLFAECLEVCRVHSIGHSAKSHFAKCRTQNTQRTPSTRQSGCLSSAGHKTLGK